MWWRWWWENNRNVVAVVVSWCQWFHGFRGFVVSMVSWFHRFRGGNGFIVSRDRRNRIAADIETNEAFPDRETNPTDFDKLEEYNPNTPRIRSPKQPGQINARPRK
ncbi:unnamed protein product [Porites lobata]|uniref:Uncharacterized protein n=1 Tax=Porites lobata TaxID=104759 RepID=A0ABN8PMF6_9CNID|nr:unnamed protein product [Porites lobata]